MKVATILFTYNRSIHTRKTLEALHNNTILPEKLYIFHDGLKCEEHRKEWQNVKEVINCVDWCDTEIVEGNENKGLAKSIVGGVTRVLREYDAAVILEDDCVTHPLFMEYHIKCLNKWRDEKKVFSVNGYSWNTNAAGNGTDVYFTGRAGSWGWSTWKDRWDLYQEDYKMLVEMKKNPEVNHQLNVWGQDLEKYLLHNIDGSSDSWAVFWALQCIKAGGFCPTPYYSLVDNVGFDGTGVHCGVGDMDTKLWEWTDIREVLLPDAIEFPENYERAYEKYFKWINPEIKLKCYNEMLVKWNRLLQRGISVADYFKERGITNIGIWGRGNLCKALLSELEGQVKVNYIIESNPIKTEYENIPVIAPGDITEDIQSIVVIPIYDMENVCKKVRGYGQNIMIGLNELLEQLFIRRKI